MTTTKATERCIEMNSVNSLNSAQSCSNTCCNIVVVDASLLTYETLLAGLIPGAQGHLLKRNQDGIEQISEILRTASLPPTASSLALHLVTPGSPGCLSLGNTQLNLKTIERYAWELQSWFSSVPSQLLLYGSRVGADLAGREFLQALHTLTGATLYASTLHVGNASLGGRWEFDVTLGANSSKPTVAFQAEAQATYPGVF